MISYAVQALKQCVVSLWEKLKGAFAAMVRAFANWFNGKGFGAGGIRFAWSKFTPRAAMHCQAEFVVKFDPLVQGFAPAMGHHLPAVL